MTTPSGQQPKLPLYLPDPFAHAAWHMKHFHPLHITHTVTWEASLAPGDEVTVGFPNALSCTDSKGSTYVSHGNGSFTAVVTSAITAGTDTRTFVLPGDRFAPFWHELADWIERSGHELAAAGGRWTACDSPGDLHKAEDIAQ